jgi:cytohesin
MKAHQNLFAVLVLVTTTGIAPASRADNAQDLFHAVQYDDKPKVKALLEVDSKLINAKNATGGTPLHSAAHWWRPQIALMLIGKGADVNAKDNNSATPLHEAAGSASSNASFLVELLLVAGADTGAQNKNGETPLHKAAERGLKARVQLLGPAGPGVKNKNGETPLTKAVLGSRLDTDIVDFMLARGAKTDIFAAALLGRTETVRALLKEKPELAKSRSRRGTTPLHIAAEHSHKDIVEMLILHGADLDAADQSRFGASPLGLARDKDVMELLLRHGATRDILGNLPKPTP